MKQTLFDNKYIGLIVIAIFLISINCFSQNIPTDKVVMLNGEEKTGEVVEIGDDFIKFVHQGEKLVYTLNKKDINKIQFASGRIEFITQTNSTDKEGATTVQSHHNVVAVLPFSYIGRGGSRDQKLELKVQSDCYNVLKKNASQFIIQDPVTTNATLIKNNINESNIAGFTPIELSTILNAEYVIYGTVTVSERGTNTSSGGYYSGKTKGNKNTGILLGGSSTSIEFSTTVDMKIYNDQGQNVFAQSHDSFWQTENAYEITLQYLIKRSPLYRK